MNETKVNPDDSNVVLFDPGSGSLYAFKVSLTINASVCVVLLLLFYLFLKAKVLKWCYRSRFELVVPEHEQKRRVLYEIPNQRFMDRNFLDFYLQVWKMNDEDLVKLVGLDSLMMMKFFKLGILFFSVIGLVGMLLLLPMYARGSDENAQEMNFFSLAHVKAKSPSASQSYWIAFACTYTFSVFLMYLVSKEFEKLFHLRKQFYIRVSSSSSNAVIIKNVPQKLQDDGLLYSEIKKIYPDLQYCFVFRNLWELHKLSEEKISVVNSLERAKILQEKKGIIGYTIHMKKFRCIESVRYYEAKLARIDQKLNILHQETHDLTDTAVAVFETLQSKQIALRKKIEFERNQLFIQDAPDTFDIYWPNIGRSYLLISSRKFLVQIAMFVLVSFYIVPISLASSLVTLNELSRFLPIIKRLSKSSPTMKAFLSGFLSTLAYKIFMLTLPAILKLMSKVEGRISFSSIEKGLFQKYFTFQFLNFFLASVFTNSLFKILSQVLNEPGTIVQSLALALPTFSSFFINFVMLETFIMCPLQLLQVDRLSKYLLCNFRKIVTDLDIWKMRDPGGIDFGSKYPMQLLVFVVALTYSCISPLILPFALLYFLINWIVCSYQTFYVYIPRYETGGSFASMAYKRIYIGLLVFQLTMIGYFQLKNAMAQSTLLIPLFVLCAVFQHQFIQKLNAMEASFYLQPLFENEEQSADKPLLSDIGSVHTCSKYREAWAQTAVMNTEFTEEFE